MEELDGTCGGMHATHSHLLEGRAQDGRDVLKEEMDKWMSATDDVTGSDLEPGLVGNARREEMFFVSRRWMLT